VVSETAHLAVDTSVAPARVLDVEAQHQSTELRWCRWPSGSGLWRLGPVPGDETAVPADHRRWSHDQHDLAESSTIESSREHCQDRPIRRGEPRTVNLALQDEDLVAKGENLCVTLVAGHQQ